MSTQVSLFAQNADLLVSAMVAPTAQAAPSPSVAAALARYPVHLLAKAQAAGTTVRPLAQGERFTHASPALRRLGVDVDAWPAPPAGLFVVAERCLYLRSQSPMTVAHEFGHALDCALGDGIYRTAYDSTLQTFFKQAKRFVTPYAATAIDEWFAEGCRAMTETNDHSSYWPRVTRARLEECDPCLYAYLTALWAGATC